jgi:hypothetical protein
MVATPFRRPVAHDTNVVIFECRGWSGSGSGEQAGANFKLLRVENPEPNGCPPRSRPILDRDKVVISMSLAAMHEKGKKRPKH